MMKNYIKQLLRERLIPEAADSPELLGKFSKDELKDLSSVTPYKNKFSYGSYHGADSANLNMAIDKSVNKSYGMDGYGIADELYKLLVTEIPSLKKLKHDNEYSSEFTKIRFDNKKEVGGGEDKVITTIELVVKYHLKYDKDLGYKKGMIKVGFWPSVRHEDAYTQQAITLGLPDNRGEEDSLIYKNLTLTSRNLNMDSFKKWIGKLKRNLGIFDHYVKRKYNHSIY